MLHLKLYGLPRTGTNAIAHNIEMTWPGLVRVWHDGSPSGETAWKHGPKRLLSGIDGYVLCTREFPAWLEAMARYPHAHMVTDDRLLPLIYRGWHTYGWNGDKSRPQHTITAMPETPSEMRQALWEVQVAFRLPEPDKYYVELLRMNRNGDAVPVERRTSDEPYRWPAIV